MKLGSRSQVFESLNFGNGEALSVLPADGDGKGTPAPQSTVNNPQGPTMASPQPAASTPPGAAAFTAGALTYTENFNSLAATGTGTGSAYAGGTLLGTTDFVFTETGGSGTTTYTANNGGSNGGDTYSYGATGSSDRAIGSVASGTVTNSYYGIQFTNNTGATITSLAISYTGEVWRVGGRTVANGADRLDFQYSTTATSIGATSGFTDYDALDFVSPTALPSTATASGGNTAPAATSSISSNLAVNIAVGGTIFIRWADSNAVGNDDGLAIDDFSITAQVAAPPSTIQFSSATYTTAEGSGGGTTNFNIAVTRSSTSGAATIGYTIAGSGANPTDAGDFVGGAAALTGSLTFADGSNTATIAVPVLADGTVEPAETFTISLGAAPSGYTLGSQSMATGTINNDDLPVFVEFTTTALSQNEGNGGGTTNFAYTVTRSGDTSGAITVPYAVIVGSGAGAASADDFPSTAGSVTFAAGSATATLNVGVVADAAFENDEAFSVVLSPGSGYSLGAQNSATGTILNDDLATIQFSAATYSVVEGNGGGTTNLNIIVTRSTAAGAATIGYSIAGSGANPASTDDFVGGAAATTGNVTFADGSNTATISVPVLADTVPEPNETFTISLGAAPSGYALGSQTTATGTITSDEFVIPGGAQTTSYTAVSGVNTLLAGVTRTQTNASAVAITAGNDRVVQIDGTINATGQRSVNVSNGVSAATINVGATGVLNSLNEQAIRTQSTTGAVTLNNQGQIISSTTAYTVQVAGSPGYVAPPNAAQAVNYNAAQGAAGAPLSDVTSGGTITNGAAGNTAALMRSDTGDSVRLGSHQTLVNYGTINGNGPVNDASTNNGLNGANGNPNTSVAQTYNASRGVRIDDNGAAGQGQGVLIDNFGTVTGAQHGVDIGDPDSNGVQVVNEAGGSIIGRNGSGVGADTTAAAATAVTVTNSGLIRGDAATIVRDRAGYVYDNGNASTSDDGGDSDGDGVDIDGGATITNNVGGQIVGTGARGFDSQGRANASEGISIGGGGITNQGTITGANTGIVVNNDTSASRSGVASTQISNYAVGTITGQTGYAIRFENKLGTGADNDFIENYGTITGNGTIPDPSAVVTIQSGAVDTNSTGTLDGVTYTGTGSARFIRGDGSAIQTGEGSDSVRNYGTITGNSGLAINLEGGADTLELYTGSTITGTVNGGAGSDLLVLGLDTRTSGNPQTGPNSGVTTGTLANAVNFEMLFVNGAGSSWTLAGSQTFSGSVYVNTDVTLTIAAGAVLNTGMVTLNGGTLIDNGQLIYTVNTDGGLYDTISGTGSLVKAGEGTLTLNYASTYQGGTTIIAGTLALAIEGAVGTGAVNFTAGAQALSIANAALDGTTHGFANAITGLAADGDRIIFSDIAPGTANPAYDSTTGTLTLTSRASGAVLATVNIGTALGNNAISLGDSGSGGTTVSLIANQGGTTGFAGTGDNDTYTGTAAADLFNLSQGGNDTVQGGAGNDGFFFGAALTADDVIGGGAGTLDQVGLQGDYAGLTLGAATMTGVEQLVLLSGGNTAYGAPGNALYSYNVATNDANIAAGQMLAVTANALQAGESVTFDASAELDGSLVYYGGLGTETITGSQQNDGFFFAGGKFGAGDVVNGQGGNLDQLALQGGYTITFGAGQLIGIEQLVLISSDSIMSAGAAAAYNYTVTMADGNVAGSAFFAVTANSLAADETLILNDTAETDASVTVYSGAGNDQIRMGALGDIVFGGAGNDLIFGNGGGDQLTGGGGNDTFGYLLATDSTGSAQDHILGFQAGDKIDLTGIGAFSLVSGDFTATNQVRITQVAGNYLVEANTGGDNAADMSILVGSDHALTAADFNGVSGPAPGAFQAPEMPAEAIASFDAHGALAMQPVDPVVHYGLGV